MKTVTLDEFIEAVKAQGVPVQEAMFVCPRCKTAQSAKDLIEAGAGKSFEDVEKYLAYSCIGRFAEGKGCNWTLGGLFQIHELEVITPDGAHHPRFRPVNIEAEVQKDNIDEVD